MLFVCAGPFLYLDVENYHSLCKTVFDYRITWVVHLASLLSASGEKNPQVCSRSLPLSLATAALQICSLLIRRLRATSLPATYHSLPCA
jgi:hypothetical protein